ncbi:substrate-binding periplasmic protein [Ramlibacter sp.]|uniref:substrate-binding periplasmic protein n=1 Tax=Ramlibacter sp. TaxID=1917967 RepID=UPI003D10FFDE
MNRRDACVLGLASAAGLAHAFGPGLVIGRGGKWVAPDIARVQARGELIVAMNSNDSPPFYYRKDKEGQLLGSDVRMAEQLALEIGVTLYIDRTPRSFDQVIEMVGRGAADMGISKLSRTLKRQQAVMFSEPYLRLKHAFLLNRVELQRLSKDRTLDQVVRDFRGTIGVIEGTSYHGFAAENFPHAKRVTYPNWDALVAAVKKGEVACAYRDEFEVRRALSQQPALAITLKTVAFSDLEDTLGIAVGYRDHALLAVANQYLEGSEKLTVEKVLNELK